MNQLIVTLIVVLLPGIVAAVICDKITVHSKWTPFKFGVYAFVLGVFSYASLQMLYYIFDVISNCSFNPEQWSHLKTWDATVSDNPSIPALEITFATLFALPTSFIAAFFINHKVFNKISQWLKVSSKYGDENLFSYYLNADEIDWIYVRDKKNNLTYQGRIVSYSEAETMQELVMSEVTVFRYEDSAELYSVPTIYLTKSTGKFVIEAVPENLLGAYND